MYAVENLQKQWYTGAKHINIKSRDSKGIISRFGGVWGKVPHKRQNKGTLSLAERSLLNSPPDCFLIHPLQSALRLSVGRCPTPARLSALTLTKGYQPFGILLFKEKKK